MKGKAESTTSAWNAFVAGATGPSFPALIGIFLTCASWITLAAWKITPSFLARVELPFYLFDGSDIGARATMRVFRLQEEEPRELAVGVFGASSQFNAIGEEAELARQLSARVGRPVPVDVHCVPGIFLPELMAQIEATKEQYPGAIIVGISPMKVGGSGTFDVRTSSLGLVRPDPSTGVYLFDQPVFLLHRIEFALVRWLSFRLPLIGLELPPLPPDPLRPKKPGRMNADQRAAWETALEEELLKRKHILDRSARDTIDPEGGLPLLQRFLEQSRERGATVILLESVLDPRLRAAVHPIPWLRYRRRMLTCAERHGAHYWDLSEQARLTPEDFIDIGHVTTAAGRERYRQALAERLAPLLKSRIEARR